MSKALHVEATATIAAPARDIYRLIADYHEGHPRIIPPKYFRNLQVEKGGYGAGTVITFEMLAFGRTYKTRGEVTEPEPGRVLVETYPVTKVVTTFTVEPIDEKHSSVTIASDLPTQPGIRGWIERAMLKPFLKRVYAEELGLIETQVRVTGGRP